jgi:hypothetical protein
MRGSFVVRWLLCSSIVFLFIAGFLAFMVYVPYSKEIAISMLALGSILTMGYALALVIE